MSPIRATVKDGRLVLNEPTSLPEGTTLDLVIDDGGDTLSPEERKVLDDAIAKAWASAQAGKLRPADQLIAELRARRRSSSPPKRRIKPGRSMTGGGRSAPPHPIFSWKNSPPRLRC